jgi:phage host-nuclease inhibitor protein Gam
MKKMPTTTIVEKAQLDQATLEYRRLAAKLARATLAKEKKIAELEAEHAAAVAEDVTALQALFDDVQSWAVLNREAHFQDAKSMYASGAVIGFRSTPPAIKQVRGVKAEHSLVRLKSLAADKYVRTVEEINKEALLTDRLDLGPAFFASAGLYVHQDEKFFIDPVSDVLDPKSQNVTS